MLFKIFLSFLLFSVVENVRFHRKIRRASFGHRRKDKDGCYIVKFREGLDGGQAELCNKVKGRDGVLLDKMNACIKCNLRPDVVEMLADDDAVEYVAEDMLVTSNFQQVTGPEYWNLDRVDQTSLPLDNSFIYQHTGEGVPIYIFDTGVNGAHQEFAGRMGEGIDLITTGGNPNIDCNGHGTHVAGIAAGTLSGIAKNATIVSVRLVGCGKVGAVSTVMRGVDWLISNKKSRGVIVMSFGTPNATALDDAVAKAVEYNFTVVAAAGNNNADACKYSPASSPKVITVAATDIVDQRANFSNWGSCVNIFAPGRYIWSASNNSDNGFANKSGTSMATPMVAGAAAVYLGWNPSLTPDQIATILQNEATSGVVQDAKGSPNLLLKTLGIPGLTSRSPSPSPVPSSPAPSPVPLSAPSNDNCVNATELKCGTTVRGTTNFAAFDATSGTCNVTHTSPEVWYFINVPAGRFTLSTCNNATFDTKLTVWRGNCAGGNTSDLECVGGADDTPAQCSRGTTVLNQTTSTAGHYLVMVHGYMKQTGDFSLTLTC